MITRFERTGKQSHTSLEVLEGKMEEEEEVAADENGWSFINKIDPIWLREPHGITKEAYAALYKSITKGPPEHIAEGHITSEGLLQGILFLPKSECVEKKTQHQLLCKWKELKTLRCWKN